MMPEETKLAVETNLIVGIELEDEEFRRFLKAYYAELQERFSDDELPAFSVDLVLDEVMLDLEPRCAEQRAGGRLQALRGFAERQYGLELTITGSDYGKLDRRSAPYSPERISYQLGRRLVTANVAMEYPGYNPYRSTREVNIPFARECLGDMMEVLPDYLWWEIQDQKEAVQSALAPENLKQLRETLQEEGYGVASFSLFLSSFEWLEFSEDE